jgi:N-acetylmuramoyl-L-alanine amidase CwlA
MLPILEMLAPLGRLCRAGKPRTGMIGVTIHETDNWSPGAGAVAHARYLQEGGTEREVSWHYAVDDTEITRSIPENECAWHAGDTGNGRGNTQTIAIEICVNPDSDYETAKQKAAWLAADILMRHGLARGATSLFQHFDHSGKHCPRRIRDEGKWPEFVAMVEWFMEACAVEGPVKPELRPNVTDDNLAVLVLPSDL